MTHTVNLQSLLLNAFTPHETLGLISPGKGTQASRNFKTEPAVLTFGVLKCFHGAALNSSPLSLSLLLEGKK